jgi:glycosyltransferase involved in cell wall biosynthesis
MKIVYVPYQPHCFAFGGFEVQMLSTLKSVQLANCDASKIDIWERNSDFDIMHFWGLEYAHEATINFAVKAGKKIVITALFPDFNSLNRRFRHFISTYAGPAKFKIQIAEKVDSIVVVNEVEAHIATKYYKIPASKITYIPNIVHEKYFNSVIESDDFYGLNNYVLCTGNICPRKNQLNLAKACAAAGAKLVLLGNTMLGENNYATQVKNIIDQNADSMIWIKGVKENTDELLHAYQRCAVFALPSLHEQGPISAYEAVATNCPVILADKPYSYQHFYKNIQRVDPKSITSIASSIKKIITNPVLYKSFSKEIDECKSENVGEKYVQLYNKLMFNQGIAI